MKCASFLYKLSQSFIEVFKATVLVMSCHFAIVASRCLAARMDERFPLLSVSCYVLPFSPVHFKMLSVHAVFGLPFLLSPPTSPVIRLFSILSLCCRMMCPKYRSFLIFTCDISSCLVPAMECTCL